MISARRPIIVLLILVALAATAAVTQLPGIGAGALLYPVRQRVTAGTPAGCEDTAFAGEGLMLKGWRCRAAAPRRATLVYLHGVGDTRASATGVIARFLPRGFDVIAYDSRAHGESEGEVCSYGVYEKDDLRRVIDTAEGGPILLVGTSLGAAVAIQHAARDARVVAVVAAEPFSDLRTIANDRAPFVFPQGLIDRALALAEERGRFSIDAASPLRAASSIAVPVLLIHGADDTDTSPDHARRLLAALPGPKRLILVPDSGHNQSLSAELWREIERWLDDALSSPGRRQIGNPRHGP